MQSNNWYTDPKILILFGATDPCSLGIYHLPNNQRRVQVTENN